MKTVHKNDEKKKIGIASTRPKIDKIEPNMMLIVGR